LRRAQNGAKHPGLHRLVTVGVWEMLAASTERRQIAMQAAGIHAIPVIEARL
jgi:hypothetical protein